VTASSCNAAETRAFFGNPVVPDDEFATLATAAGAIGYRSDLLESPQKPRMGYFEKPVSPQYRSKHFGDQQEEILGLCLGSESYRVNVVWCCKPPWTLRIWVYSTVDRRFQVCGSIAIHWLFQFVLGYSGSPNAANCIGWRPGGAFFQFAVDGCRNRGVQRLPLHPAPRRDFRSPTCRPCCRRPGSVCP
jgi:hypothetical protein